MQDKWHARMLLRRDLPFVMGIGALSDILLRMGPGPEEPLPAPAPPGAPAAPVPGPAPIGDETGGWWGPPTWWP